MSLFTSQTFFLISLAIVLVLLYHLTPILTPFLFGAILAYLASPGVKWLDRKGVPHTASVIFIFIIVFGVLVTLLLMLIPLVQQQFVVLIKELPNIITWIQDNILPWLQETVDESTLASSLPKASWIFSAILHSGANMIDVMVSCVLTPVVTFYLLRDWDDIITGIRGLLPRAIEPTIVKLVIQCDEVLGAFFRGQLLIMLALCLIYSTGLMLTGLDLGLIIGLIGGLLSIVPYLGSIFVVVAASIASLVQFGTIQSVGWVLIIYAIGQMTEGYVLTPYLIGDRIGLHPVAVIFAVMAGGVLFGFFGVLLALPVAAIIMVIVRYAVQRYIASPLYR